jgi:hypothetical protein
MVNMSYCRFENTARDLKDCLNAIQDNKIHDLSSMYEVNGLEDLLHYCEVISSHKDEIEEAVKQGNIEHSF